MRFKLFGIIWDFTNVILNIYVFINPSFWINVGKYSEDWDKRLRAELNNPVFSSLSEYTVVLNGKEIWICNYPYGSGSEYGENNCIPSRKTRFLLNKALKDKRNFALSDNVIRLNKK